MAFAFDEFGNLCKAIPHNKDVVKYICALMSELAYYYVTEDELDEQYKRVRLLVPSIGYNRMVLRGPISNIATIIGGTSETDFVVSTRNVVAVTKIVKDKVFISYRGTFFLYDWLVNLAVDRVTFHPPHRYIWPGECSFHRGFAFEALRVNALIKERLISVGQEHPKQLYLTGHSLGGAIAAVSMFMYEPEDGGMHAVTFGAPRYADVKHYLQNPDMIPMQIQRHGDIVPYVPPKSFGYADHALARYPDGRNVKNKYGDFISYNIWRLSKFVVSLASFHSIEKYRKDVGQVYGATNWNFELIDESKLR